MPNKFLRSIIVLTTLLTVTACGNTNDLTAPLPDNQDTSASSLFGGSIENYEKIHPKYFNLKYPVAVIAHRGYRDVAPENTLAAFKRAHQIGVNMIELDVHLTKDRRVVLMHDNTLDRTTNGKGPVEEKTLEELKKFDAGSWFNPVFKGEQIPTLDEVFEFAKGKISVNIEIKPQAVEIQRQEGIERKVIDIITKYGMEEYVLISSFSDVAITRVKQINPRIPTALLTAADAIFVSELKRVSKVKSDAINEFKTFVSKRDIENSHKQNLRVNVWTVNEPHEMSELIDKKVDGLITDRPDLALRVLEEKFPVNASPATMQ